MALRVGTTLPSFAGGLKWFNGEPQSSTSNSAILVHFWAMSCPSCKANMPDVQRLRDTYRDSGLYVVAVHMPRNESDTDVEAVSRSLVELGITEPCAVDNDHAIGNRFDTTGFWPYYYVFDSQLKLRRHAAGGSGLALVERVLERILAHVENE